MIILCCLPIRQLYDYVDKIVVDLDRKTWIGNTFLKYLNLFLRVVWYQKQIDFLFWCVLFARIDSYGKWIERKEYGFI
jgi:hypothetical protein